ncbi:hypothetical protein [Dawidia soli]|uniref:Uncharacterized protein n=1 Tax=Dawidia soli TaxID=2782352 RepID=A0AAP2DAV4_9BACT|nr:hypothetical protein [Dawidia soli]MBT1688499.1 hypothetical protein [Dawidia soli]
MTTYTDNTHTDKNKSVAQQMAQMKINGKPAFEIVDNRPETVAWKKLRNIATSSQTAQSRYIQVTTDRMQAKPTVPFQSAENTSEHPIQRAVNDKLAPTKFNMAGETDHRESELEVSDKKVMTMANMAQKPYYAEDAFNITIGSDENKINITGDTPLLSDLHVYELDGRKRPLQLRGNELTEFHGGVLSSLSTAEPTQEDQIGITEDITGIIKDIKDKIVEWLVSNKTLTTDISEYLDGGSDYGIGPRTHQRIDALTKLMHELRDNKQAIGVNSLVTKLEQQTNASDLKSSDWNAYPTTWGKLQEQITKIDLLVAGLKTTMPEVFNKDIVYDTEKRGEDTSAARSMVMHKAAVQAEQAGVTALWKVGNAHVNDIINNKPGESITYNLIPGDRWNKLVTEAKKPTVHEDTPVVRGQQRAPLVLPAPKGHAYIVKAATDLPDGTHLDKGDQVYIIYTSGSIGTIRLLQGGPQPSGEMDLKGIALTAID